MNLRFVMLYFLNPPAVLDARKTVATDQHAHGGASVVASIVRGKGGFLIAFRRKLVFVPDSNIEAAECVDEDGPTTEATSLESAPPGAEPSAPPPPSANELRAQVAKAERMANPTKRPKHDA